MDSRPNIAMPADAGVTQALIARVLSLQGLELADIFQKYPTLGESPFTDRIRTRVLKLRVLPNFIAEVQRALSGAAAAEQLLDDAAATFMTELLTAAGAGPDDFFTMMEVTGFMARCRQLGVPVPHDLSECTVH
jgi:hypothetical protein